MLIFKLNNFKFRNSNPFYDEIYLVFLSKILSIVYIVDINRSEIVSNLLSKYVNTVKFLLYVWMYEHKFISKLNSNLSY